GREQGSKEKDARLIASMLGVVGHEKARLPSRRRAQFYVSHFANTAIEASGQRKSANENRQKSVKNKMRRSFSSRAWRIEHENAHDVCCVGGRVHGGCRDAAGQGADRSAESADPAAAEAEGLRRRMAKDEE